MKHLGTLFIAGYAVVFIAWFALLMSLGYYGVVYLKQKINEKPKVKVPTSMHAQFRPCVWPNTCKTQA